MSIPIRAWSTDCHTWSLGAARRCTWLLDASICEGNRRFWLAIGMPRRQDSNLRSWLPRPYTRPNPLAASPPSSPPTGHHRRPLRRPRATSCYPSYKGDAAGCRVVYQKLVLLIKDVLNMDIRVQSDWFPTYHKIGRISRYARYRADFPAYRTLSARPLPEGMKPQSRSLLTPRQDATPERVL
jgi:hypothetical protein